MSGAFKELFQEQMCIWSLKKQQKKEYCLEI